MIYAHATAGRLRWTLLHPIYLVLAAVLALYFVYFVGHLFAPHGPGWQLLCHGDLVDVHAERKLYMSGRSKDFILHVRVTNRTDKPIGVGNVSSTPGRAAAFEYWTWWADLDCDCPGEHQFLQPDLPPRLDEIRSRCAIRAYRTGRLVKLAPHQSVDFYAGVDDSKRTFHHGPLSVSAQCAAVSTGIIPGVLLHRLMHSQILPSAAVKLWMFGYCIATDGDHVECVSGPRDLIISDPVTWGTVPTGATVSYGAVDGDYVEGDR